MNSRTLINLVMLAVVVVLVLVAVYEPGRNEQPQKVLLTRLTADEINSITIQRAEQQQAIVLKKQDGHWLMQSPYQLPANQFRIESLMKLAGAESLSRHEMAELDKKLFGLDKPRISIRFNDSETIHFGGTEPLQQRRYLQVGNILHLVMDLYYYQVAADTTSFIDHQLLPGGLKITGLKLPELQLSLTEGTWQAKPGGDNFSVDSVTHLLNEWRLSQAYQLKIHKDELPGADIIIETESSGPISFSIIASENDFILLRHDNRLQYILSKDRQPMLLTLPDKSATEKNATSTDTTTD